jgi:hypothetical protein
MAMGMSRRTTLGIATVVAGMIVSLLIADDAEARLLRWRRSRTSNWGYNAYNYNGGGACGCAAPVSTCGSCGYTAAPACGGGCETGACGVATSACATGTCGIAGAASTGFSGGYSAGYGSSVQGQNYAIPPRAPQGSFDQAPPAPNGGGAATFRGTDQNGNVNNPARSPSDRGDNRAPSSDRDSDRSAPPPPPSQEQ